MRLMHWRSRSPWSAVSGDSSGALSAWEPAVAPSTELVGANANGNGVGKPSGRPRWPARTRPQRTCTVPSEGPRRRPAGGAVDPTLRAAGGPSRSGARPLPAPGLGAGQGRCFWTVRGGARRAVRRGPCASPAHPPRLARAARRARRPAEGRTGLRRRPARLGAGPGPRTGDVPATRAPHRRSPPALKRCLQGFCSSQKERMEPRVG
jgi:hypothetical protein